MQLVSHKLVEVTVVYMEKSTQRLFIPFVEETWLDKDSGELIQVLINEHFTVNGEQIEQNFIKLPFRWSTIFQFNPQTLMLQGSMV